MNARKAVRKLLIVYVSAIYVLLAAANAPRLIGWTPTVVLSGSMRPSIHAGDVVVLEPVRRGDVVSVGDVITVSAPDTPGGTYLHRVVATSVTGTLVTRGDANRQDDFPAVDRGLVRGRTRLVLPFVGAPYLALRDGDPAPLVATAAPLLLLARVRPPSRRRPRTAQSRRRAVGIGDRAANVSVADRGEAQTPSRALVPGRRPAGTTAHDSGNLLVSVTIQARDAWGRMLTVDRNQPGKGPR